ncbi:hypothetical protein ASD37_09930 [Mycobacterium sp. Root135]|nr:hypothetical protein ASD37_09930 [Mycobacterium sp. Root135]
MPLEECWRCVVLVVVGAVLVVVVAVVDGEVVPVDPQATVSAPMATAAASPTVALRRREVLVTNDIPTHASCEIA